MKIILIGGSKLAYFLTKQFASKNYYTTIINSDLEEAQTLSRTLKATVIHGQGSDPATLGEAGALQADVVLSLTTHDEDNLIACQIAQKEYGVPRTIALVNDPENQQIFPRRGMHIHLPGYPGCRRFHGQTGMAAHGGKTAQANQDAP